MLYLTQDLNLYRKERHVLPAGERSPPIMSELSPALNPGPISDSFAEQTKEKGSWRFLDLAQSGNSRTDVEFPFFFGCYRSALRNDRAANCARARGWRKIASMSPRGGFCLLPTSRTSREGIPQHLAAVAKTGGRRKQMTMIVSRGLAISLKTLHIRAMALNGRSSTFRCVRITTQLSHIRGISRHAGVFPLENLNKSCGYYLSRDP